MNQKMESSASLQSKRKTSKLVDKKLQMLRKNNDATINSKIKDLSKNISQNQKTSDLKGTTISLKQLKFFNFKYINNKLIKIINL